MISARGLKRSSFVGNAAGRCYRVGLALLLPALIVACSAPLQRFPVPEADLAAAQPYGIPGQLRTFGDIVEAGDLDRLLDERTQSAQARYEEIRAAGDGVAHREVLALSGGGGDGAYGAGFLAGWTARGDRPDFEVVTGISAGALMAPFAFLGSDYDEQLTELFTTFETADLLEPTLFSGVIAGDSIADSAGLRGLIERYADRTLIARIAAENNRGRRLLVTTTNLDASRPVIWDIGYIAASGHPDAMRLIHDVLLASASIPVAFPPVLIPVRVADQTYDEMHVDGGATQQVSLFSPSVPLGELFEQIGIADAEQTIYVIVNNKLRKPYKPVRPRLLAIAGQSMTSLINGQGTGDLYKIFAIAQRDDFNVKITSIPRSFDLEPEEPFDTAYMGALFELGYDAALRGDSWLPHPPDYRETLEVVAER